MALRLEMRRSIDGKNYQILIRCLMHIVQSAIAYVVNTAQTSLGTAKLFAAIGSTSLKSHAFNFPFPIPLALFNQTKTAHTSTPTGPGLPGRTLNFLGTCIDTAEANKVPPEQLVGDPVGGLVLPSLALVALHFLKM